VVQRLKTLCPLLGKAKIAQTLARAVLHPGVTTVLTLLLLPAGFASSRGGLAGRTCRASDSRRWILITRQPQESLDENIGRQRPLADRPKSTFVGRRKLKQQ
jgi:hypothetical protein